MKIVIDIPRKIYERIRAEGGHKCFNMWYDDHHIVAKAVYNGISLPKGHGRLIDADAIPRHLVRDIDEIDKQPTIIEGSDTECQE